MEIITDIALFCYIDFFSAEKSLEKKFQVLSIYLPIMSNPSWGPRHILGYLKNKTTLFLYINTKRSTLWNAHELRGDNHWWDFEIIGLF